MNLSRKPKVESRKPDTGTSGIRCSRPPNFDLRLTAFTLLELIIVMALIIIVISVASPTLKNFFHGRSLDSEARRLLALTRVGQTRAVSEGVPMVLWVDSTKKSYGLEAEPGYEDHDTKAQDYSVASDLQIQVVNAAGKSAISSTNLIHADLPQIRFLPDGSYDGSSPAAVALSSQDGTALWLAQSRNHLNYEIRDAKQ